MKKKSNNWKNFKFGWLLLFLFSFQPVFAQFPYVIKPKLDYSIIGAGAISLTTGMVLTSNDQILTQAEINSFYPNQVNALDRPTIYNHNEAAKTASNVFVAGAILSPISLLGIKEVRQHYLTVGIMGMEVLMVSYGLISTTKTIALRTRPYVYNPEIAMEEKQTLDARYSFFSGHTAGAASMTFFAARVYSDTHPNGKWKPMVWTAAAVVPALVGWTRVEAGMHFPTDVLAGYAVGAAIGYFVPVFHLKKDDSKASWNLQPNMNGLALKVVF
tara:strand:- start:67340 stop:68155 length:816 start_codon:yes stop_codon:yes gene_type:complete